MPKLNLDSVTAADVANDGTFRQLPADGYVVKVVDVIDEPDKERVWLVIDIAEGEYEGYYADAYGIQHPNAHRILMSYKPTALGMLKGRLKLIDACNPGFDSAAAFEADKWELFHGRVFGLACGHQLYESNTGETREKPDWFHAKWKTVDAIRDGKFIVPQLIDENGAKVDEVPRVTERSASTAVYDDIPFE